MDQKVSDRAAIEFSKRLYERLVFRGKSVQEAYDQASDLVAGKYPEQHAHPCLRARPGVDPSSVYLFKPLSETVPEHALAQLIEHERA